MTQRLTMRLLSSQLALLERRLEKLEDKTDHNIERAINKASSAIVDKKQVEPRDFNTLRVPGVTGIDNQTRLELIGELAYLRAEQRGFKGGSQEQDWLEAEMEIDSLLLHGWTIKSSKTPVPPDESKSSKD